jgi:hypothetical protein
MKTKEKLFSNRNKKPHDSAGRTAHPNGLPAAQPSVPAVVGVSAVAGEQILIASRPNIKK